MRCFPFDASAAAALLAAGFAGALLAGLTVEAGAQTARPAAPPAGQQKAKAAPAAESGRQKQAAVAAAPAGASLLESFGDWGAYATPGGKTRICYALAQPKDRLPKTLNRDPGYLFVSFRKPENVANEVAMVLGFPVKEDSDADMKLTIDRASFPLLGKGSNAWLRDPSQEAQAVAAMAKGQAVTVNAVSIRGNKSTDRYPLGGFAKALERARAECK